jgi:tetratricopeptide (TPR) repeat protein
MRQHLKAIDNAHGGGASLPMASWYLQNEIIPLLNGCGGDPTVRPLAHVAAEVHLDVGWAAYDAGAQDLATHHFHAALRLAHTLEDRLLGGRILAAMSHQAIHLGHLSQAIEFAQAARTRAGPATTPRTTAMLATMQACAHAAASEPKSAHAALDEAADAIMQAASDQPDPDWLDFDEGGYWGHAARAHRDLGELRRAERCAAKSIGLCNPGHGRTRAQRTTIAATTYLRLGDVDAAAAAGEHLVREAWNLHSGLVFTEVAQLTAALQSFQGPSTKSFLDQSHDLLHARRPMLTASSIR